MDYLFIWRLNVARLKIIYCLPCEHYNQVNWKTTWTLRSGGGGGWFLGQCIAALFDGKLCIFLFVWRDWANWALFMLVLLCEPFSTKEVQQDQAGTVFDWVSLFPSEINSNDISTLLDPPFLPPFVTRRPIPLPSPNTTLSCATSTSSK